MSHAEEQEHLSRIAERLDEITAALLSGEASRQTMLMVERRLLLAQVASMCERLEAPSLKQARTAAPGMHAALELIKS